MVAGDDDFLDQSKFPVVKGINNLLCLQPYQHVLAQSVNVEGALPPVRCSCHSVDAVRLSEYTLASK